MKRPQAFNNQRGSPTLLVRKLSKKLKPGDIGAPRIILFKFINKIDKKLSAGT
uniref:Uncharacterized protein n=1 Tax=Anaerobacillus isosaccharinicus TaxID=1532552 RepID=A0A7S7L6B5_9BACI|nr:hypothetical protein [Anaerobacillus isosaccharinicus]QOY35214.1 hypothetical protein AWH56_021335 [Anaerobacillus isosaccharinicus]